MRLEDFAGKILSFPHPFVIDKSSFVIMIAKGKGPLSKHCKERLQEYGHVSELLEINPYNKTRESLAGVS